MKCGCTEGDIVNVKRQPSFTNFALNRQHGCIFFRQPEKKTFQENR